MNQNNSFLAWLPMMTRPSVPSRPWPTKAGHLLGLLCAVLLFAGSAHGTQVPAAPKVGRLSLCQSCHGPQGEGGPAGQPRLAGQSEAYLVHALQSFHDGKRSGLPMEDIAQGLDPGEIPVLAHYFAGLPPRSRPQPAADVALVSAGRALAKHGAAGLPACLSCHDPAALAARAPALDGQPRAYLQSRLDQFQARARHAPPPPGSMTAVAAGLDAAQIEQLSAYFAQRPPGQTAP